MLINHSVFTNPKSDCMRMFVRYVFISDERQCRAGKLNKLTDSIVEVLSVSGFTWGVSLSSREGPDQDSDSATFN